MRLCERCKFQTYVKIGEGWISAGCSMCDAKQGAKNERGEVIECETFEEEEEQHGQCD